jgi:hypothetical protein
MPKSIEAALEIAQKYRVTFTKTTRAGVDIVMQTLAEKQKQQKAQENKSENKKNDAPKKTCAWCQYTGHTEAECRGKAAGKPRRVANQQKKKTTVDPKAAAPAAAATASTPSASAMAATEAQDDDSFYAFMSTQSDYSSALVNAGKTQGIDITSKTVIVLDTGCTQCIMKNRQLFENGHTWQGRTIKVLQSEGEPLSLNMWGYVRGYGNGLFNPNANCNLASLACVKAEGGTASIDLDKAITIRFRDGRVHIFKHVYRGVYAMDVADPSIGAREYRLPLTVRSRGVQPQP